jgi:cytochrome c biogenesis protein CcmG, thiol:disulfide interchange protein DsbE
VHRRDTMAFHMSISRRLLFVVTLLAVLGAACAPSTAKTPADPLPTVGPDDFMALLETSTRPVVVNIWASWCGPCRSEAPLLREASQMYGSQIRFIGVDVNDTQSGASAFLSRYGIDFEQYFDPRSAILTALRSTGVPHTFFFAPGGELEFAQHGIIDEHTLAVHIDNLLR